MSFYARHCGWWDWRLSARLRAASLGGLWLLLIASPLLGWLLLPLAGFRMVAGLGQLFLNHHLGRTQPLDGRDRIDWTLLGVTLLASSAVAQVGASTGTESAWLLLPVALPFTAIQLRMCVRSLRAFERAGSRQPRRLEFPAERARRAA